MKDFKDNLIYKKVLEVAQDLDEIGGVATTEEYVAIMDELVFEFRRRAITARVSHLQSALSENTRKKLINSLYNAIQDLHTDISETQEEGQCFIGWNHMSDEELVEEYSHYVREDDDLVLKAITEIETHKMLKG